MEGTATHKKFLWYRYGCKVLSSPSAPDREVPNITSNDTILEVHREVFFVVGWTYSKLLLTVCRQAGREGGREVSMVRWPFK